MIDPVYKAVEESCITLRVDFTGSELAKLATENGMSMESIQAVADVFAYLKVKKEEATIQMLLRTSRLPLKDIKTFQNFDFDVLKSKDIDKLKNLATLAPVYAHKNIMFIGPAGIGKTHLAQAFGYECCQQGMKSYFIKASELRDKFVAARKAGTESRVMTNMVRPSCLIIDEIGRCEFGKEDTRMFFDLIDRRYTKEGTSNIVFTSNKNPSRWVECFHEDDSLLCALDRIFDTSVVFNFRGESYRGKGCESYAIQAGRTGSEAFTAPSTV